MMKLDEVLKSNEYVLIDFYSSTCPPCKLIEIELKEVKSTLGEKVEIYKVDQEEQESTFKAFKIKNLPHVKLFKSGRPVWEYSGLLSKDEFIEEILKR